MSALSKAAAWRALTAGLMLFVSACAQERDPINRVQPEALSKAFFVGEDLVSTEDDPEFYKRGTLVDVPYGAEQSGLFTSTYAQPLSRIRWEITEQTLNARLAYERISGTDGKGNPVEGVERKPAHDGQLVASYKILSHFDIQRDYNPQTGEELNVTVENDQDRPWFDRTHFRVDWSKNLVTDVYDYDTLALVGIFGGIDYQPVSYTVLDPKHPDAPHFEAEEGYFDVTNKVYASPKTVDLSGLGIGIDEIPTCFLSGYFGGSDPWGNCNPVELTIRESYRRVVDTDYEPVDHDGVRFSTLGAFNFNYRRGYDRHYGMLDAEWNRFISRYNIWERSHFYEVPEELSGPIPCATFETTEEPTGDPNANPNRDEDENGTADECEAAGPGSRCDVHSQKCTLPYRQRTSLTIPWYIAGDTSLFEASDAAVVQWDLAMKTAVMSARLIECRTTGGDDCDARYPMWRGQQDDNDEAIQIAIQVTDCRRNEGWEAEECNQLAEDLAKDLAAARGDSADPSTLAIAEVINTPSVFVLCHNPVEDDDHPACGEQGLAPRMGDIRFHQVVNVEKPQTQSPWGIMADGDDPLTGEKVVGSMNIWTHVTDLAAQNLVDLALYANGELETDEVTNGEYVRKWAEAANLSGKGALPTLPKADIESRLASVSQQDVDAFHKAVTTELPGDVNALLRQGKHLALDAATRSDVASPALAKQAAALHQARGTDLEAELINRATLELSGLPAAATLDDKLASAVSPMALNNPLIAARLYEMQENALAARGACIMRHGPEPTAIAGLASILKKKFPISDDETASDRRERHQRMFDYVRRRYHTGIMAHEMGHSVGLRHNFVSSSAPLHYRPQYWQLRTRNGEVSEACTDAVSDGEGCVGPRYFDPVTKEEQSQLIWTWMQSSVMDYAGEVTQDMLGLGVTDFAAARFFYGDTVSVYASDDYAAGTSIGTGISAATDTFGGLLGIRHGVRGNNGDGTTDLHYSQLQNAYDLIDDCYDVDPKAPEGWEKGRDGKWHPVLDGQIISVDGQPKKCRQQPVDYVRYSDLRMPRPVELNGGFYNGGPSVEPETGRTRVPYAFASDSWADTGNVSVFRHDNGADPYELVQFLINTQETHHVFDQYRRGRSTFNVRGAAMRSFMRYGQKLQGAAGGMGLLRTIYADLGLGQGYSFEALWPLVVGGLASDNMIAATVVFDHFTRQLTRPQAGEHYRRPDAFADPVLHSATDPDDFGPAGGPLVVVPNGVTGYPSDVGFGGQRLENALAEDKGDFNVEFVQNAGSYYDKVWVPLLLAESEDRFVSSSRRDFYDARFRAVGMADVLPDAYRRLIGNALTQDRSLLAPRVVTNEDGFPLLDATADDSADPLAPLYPERPLGWVSLWPSSGPEICFPSGGRNACSNYARTGDLDAVRPNNMAPVDPQIGWEVQKFVMAWTVALIKANEKRNWLDMLRVYRVGPNVTPEIEARIEWQDPDSGELYYAPTYGTECFFGSDEECSGGTIVQKGIAARVLQYANQLTAKGYQLDTDAYPEGVNEYGRAMVMRHPDGTPIVVPDPAVAGFSVLGALQSIDPCDLNVDSDCTPLTETQNHFAHELAGYKSVPHYLWQASVLYGLSAPPSRR